jgi:hypothetical protein
VEARQGRAEREVYVHADGPLAGHLSLPCFPVVDTQAGRDDSAGQAPERIGSCLASRSSCVSASSVGTGSPSLVLARPHGFNPDLDEESHSNETIKSLMISLETGAKPRDPAVPQGYPLGVATLP